MDGILVSSILIYCVLTYILGNAVIRRWFLFTREKLFEIASSVLVGTLIMVPLTYAISSVVTWSSEKIIWGVSISMIVVGLVLLFTGKLNSREKNIRLKEISLNEILLIIMTSGISIWMMWKTIHVGDDGTLYVAKNTVFDTGHAISVIRSFSWGNNIPFLSPFAGGYRETYHFFFYFLVACLERFSIPLIVALNGLSSLGFTLYLVIGYYLPQILFQQKRAVGWITVLLLLTHSTLTWWFALQKFGFSIGSGAALWRISDYLFAGPYDGSVISLFYTLNVFVNQRHLAIGIAMAVWILMAAIMHLRKKSTEKTSVFILGILTGLMIFWNVVLCWTVVVIVIMYILIWKKYSYVWVALCGFVIPVFIFFLPYVRLLTVSVGGSSAVIREASVNIGSVIARQCWYWVNNLGFGIIAFVVGLYAIFRTYKKEIIPYTAVFLALCIGINLERYEIAQKVLNFWNVWFVALCAIGVYWIWGRRSLLRLVAVPLGIVLVASGIIDMMVIKNDFQYPAYTPRAQVIAYMLNANVPQQAIILSYREMFHPVGLSGRTQYYGFFSPPQSSGRGDIVKTIFEASTSADLRKEMNKTPVSYIYLPKSKRTDFPYIVHTELFSSLYTIVFETDDEIMFRVR